jgi:hypothetical protein
MPTLQAQALTLKAKLYRGLADPSRLFILEALRSRRQDYHAPMSPIICAASLTAT